jgi:DNA-binding FrmR family transcriptional regulator
MTKIPSVSTSPLSLKIKKVEGQVRRVAAMIARGDYCIDIIQQNLAAIGLLKSLQTDLLQHHLTHCFQAGLDNSKRRTQMTEELIKVFKYSNK